MLYNLEALIYLAECGTMQRAAYQLRVTQSAVSKRIAELERRLDRKLIEPRGRKVALTAEGARLVDGARPLLEQLRGIVQASNSEGGRVSVEVSGSVLISWAASALGRITKKALDLEVDIRTNHASVAVERVRSGVSMVALAQGQSTIAPDLTFLPLYDEQLVIVPRSLKRFKFPTSGVLPVLAIEQHTEAWAFTKRAVKAANLPFTIKVERELQSFSAIVQLARAGFGHGLVPHEVAQALGVDRRKIAPFPKPGLSIPVSFIGRKTTLGLPVVRRLYEALRADRSAIDS